MATIRELLRDRIITALGGVPAVDATRRATESYVHGYDDGNDDPASGDIAKGGYGYTVAGAPAMGITGLPYGRILNTALDLWYSNPVARRYIQIKTDHIVGRGLAIRTEDEDLQQILDSFWKTNKMETRIREFTCQLFLLGEQIYPVFVRESDGAVRLGYIGPDSVHSVVQHPENALERWAVVLKPSENVTQHYGKRAYRIVRADEGYEDNGGMITGVYGDALVTAKQSNIQPWELEMLKDCGLADYTGSCLYYGVNAMSNQPRGYSDLLAASDWLDQIDSVLFALADREQQLNYWAWDVTVRGLEPDQVTARAREIARRVPPKGGANIHNEAEEWVPNTPDLKQRGTVETSSTLLAFVLGGLGIPVHWYGSGDDTNRATAQAQGDPTWKSLQAAQGTVGGMITEMLAFVRDQARIARTWNGDPDTAITVEMPEMTSSDTREWSEAARNVAAALAVAADMGIPTEKVLEVWAKIFSEIGIGIEVDFTDIAPEPDVVGEALNEAFAARVAEAQRGNGNANA